MSSTTLCRVSRPCLALDSVACVSRGTNPLRSLTIPLRLLRTTVSCDSFLPARFKRSYRLKQLYSSQRCNVSMRKYLSTTTTVFNKNPENMRPESRNDLGKVEVKMAIQFTCKVCLARNTKSFSKLAYTSGVVIIQCDGCKNRHLIADNLGWFDHIEARNIEQMLEEKGETVRRGQLDGSVDISDLDNAAKSN